MPYTIGLQIQAKDGEVKEESFSADSVLIGSGPSAVLRLDDSEVSSIHAVIKATPEGTFTIIDLGSEAGTSVNGSPVTEAVTLKVGDSIAVGGVAISVTKLDQAEEAEEKPAKAHELADTEETVETEEPPAKAKTEKAAEIEQATQVIRERNTPAEPVAGSNIVTSSSDLDISLLSKDLPKENKPTSDERALEITVFWGNTAIDRAQITEPRKVTVGGRATGRRASWFTKPSKIYDLELEGDLPAEQFTVAENQGTEATIIIPANAQIGVRQSDGTVTREVKTGSASASFPAKSYQLKLNERVAFKTGTLTFRAQYIRSDAAMGRGGVMDWYFPRVFTISALLHIFFVVAAFITPNLDRSLVDELFKNQNRFAQMILKAPEKDKKRKKLDLSGMKGGAKHKDDEGKFGKKDKPKKDALASKAGAPRVDPNKREKDRKIALNSGLLGILKGAGDTGAVSNVFGPGGLGTGINNAMGGLRGAAMGDAGGAGGLGTRGTGAGGGGSSLGIGGLGTHGHGRGTGGYGNIDLGGRGKGRTRIVPGRTIIKGSLSKAEIGRVIRRNLARFKYCYEKQLNANPNLAGKVSIYFTIAPTGKVAKASVRETSMGDKNVENCCLKVMRSLKFPKPRGGGIVVVTYPFVFAST